MQADRQYAQNMNIGNNVPSSIRFLPRDISQNPISIIKKRKTKKHHKRKRSNMRSRRMNMGWKLLLQLF